MKNKYNLKKGLLTIGLTFPFFLGAQTVQNALNDMYAEHYNKAKKEIQKIITAQPDETRNFFYAGFIYANTNNLDSAQIFFNQGIKMDEKAALNYVGQGYIALIKNDSVKAYSLFKKAQDNARNRNRTEVLDYTAYALLHTAHKNAKKAMELIKAGLEEAYNATNVNVIKANNYVLMGDAYLQLGQAGKAIGKYKDALSLNPDLTARMHAKIGDIYVSARNTDAAIGELEQAITIDSTYAPAYASLGDIYFYAKRIASKAKDNYTKYLKFSDAQTGIKEKLVKVLYVGKNYDKAIEEIQGVLSKDPKNVVMNRLLGYSLYRTGKYAEADKAFENYFNIVTKVNILPSDYTFYGKSLFKVGKDSLGVLNIMKAVKMDSSNISALQEVADEEVDAKEYEKASKLFDIVLKTKKDLSSQDYYSAGRAYLKAKEFTKADNSFGNLIRLAPENYIGYYMMAFSKYFQDPEGKKGYLARPYYDTVIKMTENDTAKYKSVLLNSYRYVATYYTMTKKLDKAKELWEKIEALDPGNENAKKFFEYYNKVQNYKKQQQEAAKQEGTN